jgi:PAS domain S-box-containing protein
MDSVENTRALVVEDAPDTAGQLKRVLEREFPMAVEIAPDCATARRLLSEKAFDLVTLDFMLPDGLGLDLLEEITGRGGMPRVIMVTGHGDEASAVRSFRSKASGYVIKDQHIATRLVEAAKKALLEIDLERARAEMERREAHFRTLTEKSSDMITVMRADGTVTYASPSIDRYLGYKPEDLIGHNAFDFLHPEDRPRVVRMVEGSVDTPGALLIIEYRFRHKEGPWRFLESVGRNLLTDPAVGGIVINSRDVTARKRAEGELEKYRKNLEQLVHERTAELAAANINLREEVAERKQAQAELQERAERLADFLTVTSHELRHPISVVKGYTTMLQGYLERMDRDALLDISSALDTSVGRLTGFVEELLDVSLVEQGRYTFEIEDYDIQPLIQSSLSDLSGLGERERASVSIAEDARRVKADPSKIRRLVDMLLDNAIKFSDAGTPIEIVVERDGGRATVSVMDRGIGVPPEARERVFDRFYQVEEVSHHSTVGLGLGLYLARQIAEAHGGEIRCEGRDGGGSVFRFTLPLAR